MAVVEVFAKKPDGTEAKTSKITDPFVAAAVAGVMTGATQIYWKSKNQNRAGGG